MIRILALGSPHGDDQVAWRVVDNLARDSSSTYRALSTPTPWDILEHLSPERRVIVLDACCSGAEPGTVFRVTGAHFEQLRGDRMSTHGGDLAAILRLAGALGRLPQVLVILAVEIASAEPTSELSEQGRQAVIELERQVRQELSQWNLPNDRPA